MIGCPVCGGPQHEPAVVVYGGHPVSRACRSTFHPINHPPRDPNDADRVASIVGTLRERAIPPPNS